MNCVKTLELISEFHAGALDETDRVVVHTHLLECVTCAEVFNDVEVIVRVAKVTYLETSIHFPDEHELWRRMNLTKA
ncbi:MAG: zf-HC2 domain-containing protein [Pyrinomonadaceae bacterium]|nr:zf-HC2 domain-containing protein [Pyrinomonadaceae bacterium]